MSDEQGRLAMLSADRFRALMDELAEASPAQREAILDLPKSAPPVTIREASLLTGLPVSTLQQYLKPYWRRKMGTRAIPPLRPDRTWAAGDLALWRAGIQRDSPPVPPRRAGQPEADYPRLIPEARAALAADGISNEWALQKALSGRGIRVGIRVARRLWLAVRPEPADPDVGPLPESLRPDGLLTATQLARWARVTLSAVTRQVERGLLTPAAWSRQGWEMRNGKPRQVTYKYDVPLFDPERVAHPGPGRRAPVDKISNEGSET